MRSGGTKTLDRGSLRKCRGCPGNVGVPMTLSEGESRQMVGGEATPTARAEPVPASPWGARLTVVENVYHQVRGRPATHVEPSRFGRLLAGDGQAYVRELRASENWEPLDAGWVDPAACALLLLQNDEGRFERNPTPEERADMDARVVELGWLGPGGIAALWLIPPGESLRGTPADLVGMNVRCRKGQARFTLTLIPS